MGDISTRPFYHARKKPRQCAHADARLHVFAGVLARRSRRGKAGTAEWHVVLFALTPVLCFMFSKWVFPMWQTRYTLYAHAGLLMLLVLGCGVFGRFRRIAEGAVVAVFLAQYLSMPVPARHDWKAIARVVSDHGPVYVYPAYQWSAVLRNFPDNEVIPVKPSDTCLFKCAHHRAGWLVAVDPLPADGRFQRRYKMTPCTTARSSASTIRLWKLDALAKPVFGANAPG